MAQQFYLWERFKKSLRTSDTPRQMAAGVALGVLIGIIPKDSILCGILIVCLILSPANLLTGLLASLFFNTLSSLAIFKQWGAQLGNLVLEAPILESTWMQILQLPYAAWLRWDNNTTVGLTLAALLLSIPVYFAAHTFFSSISAKWLTQIRNLSFLSKMREKPKAQTSGGQP